MTGACFDSDVLIDFFQGNPLAKAEIGRYSERVVSVVSVVSWVEVMTGAGRGGVEPQIRAGLAGFDLVFVDWPIAEAAVALHAGRRLRSADALIWGTARALNIPLVTHSARDFPADDPGIRVPYRL